MRARRVWVLRPFDLTWGTEETPLSPTSSPPLHLGCFENQILMRLSRCVPRWIGTPGVCWVAIMPSQKRSGTSRQHLVCLYLVFPRICPSVGTAVCDVSRTLELSRHNHLPTCPSVLILHYVILYALLESSSGDCSVLNAELRRSQPQAGVHMRQPPLFDTLSERTASVETKRLRRNSSQFLVNLRAARARTKIHSTPVSSMLSC